MNLSDVARWRREQQRRCQVAARSARAACDMGNEDAGHDEAYAIEAARTHAEMATAIEAVEHARA